MGKYGIIMVFSRNNFTFMNKFNEGAPFLKIIEEPGF